MPSAYGMVEFYDFSPSVLFLDFDSGGRSAAPRLRILWSRLRIIGIRCDAIRMDRTKNGWHVVIFCRDVFSAIEKVALQAVLGSDPKRECLNLMRVRAGGGKDYRWNILYKAKLK